MISIRRAIGSQDRSSGSNLPRRSRRVEGAMTPSCGTSPRCATLCPPDPGRSRPEERSLAPVAGQCSSPGVW